MNKIPLIYILHSGQLYGTERMALVAIQGIAHKFQPIILAPPGLLLAEAKHQGITTECFQNKWDLANKIKSYLVQHKQVVFVTTSVSQSICIMLWNLFYRRQLIHLLMVHGGVDERLSYSRKSMLNYLPVKFIAVSDFVRNRLHVHGVRSQQIEVIENFLLESQIEQMPKRQPFTKSGIKRVIVVSRLDPIKRVDLLFDALDSFPELDSLEFRVFGSGKDTAKLKKRAAECHHQVSLEGFSASVLEEMANSDLLLHLCPVEPFGLAILEAIAVGLPVLVPNRGGVKTLVQHGISGFQFNADNTEDLAFWLFKLQETPAQLLNQVVSNAQKTLKSRFSEQKGIAAYNGLLDFA